MAFSWARDAATPSSGLMITRTIQATMLAFNAAVAASADDRHVVVVCGALALFWGAGVVFSHTRGSAADAKVSPWK